MVNLNIPMALLFTLREVLDAEMERNVTAATTRFEHHQKCVALSNYVEAVSGVYDWVQTTEVL